MFKLGEVKVPCDEDFAFIKSVSLNDQDWTLDFAKNNVKVWVKKNELSSFNMLKVKADLDDVTAELLYAVLQDGEYRPQWDDRMVEGFEICYISPCSDIGYYAIKMPKPFKNRDFVTQRCWLDYGEHNDKIIYNHSINHVKHPSKKGFVRGLSFMTSYFVRPTGNKSCSLYYVTQSDPGGSLPAWLVNMTTRVLAPKMVKKMQKASVKYDKWKSKNNPHNKPWMNPEFIKVPRLDWKEIVAFDLDKINENIDESQIKENDVDKNDLEEDINNNN